MKRLQPRFAISEIPSEVFVIRFSPDGSLLAAGCNDGSIRVYAAKPGPNLTTAAGGDLLYTLPAGSSEPMPVTALRFRPSNAASKTKNVLLSGSADGTIKHWHVTSGKVLSKITEADNQIYAVDYRADGSAFCTAGKDKIVRVYDDAAKSLTHSLSGGLLTVTPGHSNRVFAVKFHPDDENLILSAGWDNTVQIYDLRAGLAVRTIFGPHVCGDALDIATAAGGGYLLTGSWRPEEQLQMWDIPSGRLVTTIPWQSSAASTAGLLPAAAAARGANAASNSGSGSAVLGSSVSAAGVGAGVGAQGAGWPRAGATLVYAAAFSRDPASTYIAAGGSGNNELKVWDRSQMLRAHASGSASQLSAAMARGPQLLGTISGLSRAVYTIDWDPDSNALGLAGGDAFIRVFDLVTPALTERDTSTAATPRSSLDSVTRDGSTLAAVQQHVSTQAGDVVPATGRHHANAAAVQEDSIITDAYGGAEPDVDAGAVAEADDEPVDHREGKTR